MFEQTPENDVPPAEREVEAALARLRPASVSIDAGDALFEAGRLVGMQAARPQLYAWRMAAALIVVVAGVVFAAGRPAPKIVERERIVYVQVQPDEADAPPTIAVTAANVPTPLASAGPESMFALRQVALEKGVDRLPAAAVPGRYVPIGLRDVRVP